MAEEKRISGLDSGNPNKTYVFEMDNADGTVEETIKVTVEEVNTILDELNDSWTELTPENGWTGTLKMRVDKDGYLEIYFDVDASNATSVEVTSTIPSEFVPDYSFRRPYPGGDGLVLINFSSAAFRIVNYAETAPIYDFVGYFRAPLLAP